MAMTAVEKNVAIASMERSIEQAKANAGIATLAAMETEVTGLRTAYDTDPATVTDAQVATAGQHLTALVFPSVDDVSAVFDEAEEALAE